jgi:protein-L-isoaspartate(D-aspartate) O-methyltransferase
MKTVFLILILIILSLCSQDKDKYELVRNRMVDEQIVARGVTDYATLKAMRKVPRHLFVPSMYGGMAYDDRPLPIGFGQTISQPYIVAYMTAESQPSGNMKALEIGTGSGYQAAVLAEIVDSVYTIEIVHELAMATSSKLRELGYENIVTREGDGYIGWKEHAPFDIILVTAAADHIPQPLIDQLAENGRLIMPIGNQFSNQYLILLIKKRGKVTQTQLFPVRFVPLTRKREKY